MKAEVAKIFDDLDKYRDYCRFFGHCFDEGELYKMSSPVWRSYQDYLKHGYRPRKKKGNFRKNK